VMMNKQPMKNAPTKPGKKPMPKKGKGKGC
jgi:hypothetical protein